MKATIFPKRLGDYSAKATIRLPENKGAGAKVCLREIAKMRLAKMYHHPIETGICGKSDDGHEIPINTVGRWLFGTPGYMGHIRVTNWNGLDAQIEYPKESPELVHTLITDLKTVVEAGER